MEIILSSDNDTIFFCALFAIQVDPSMLEPQRAEVDGPEGVYLPGLKEGAQIIVSQGSPPRLGKEKFPYPEEIGQSRDKVAEIADVKRFFIMPFVTGDDSEEGAKRQAMEYLLLRCPPADGWFSYYVNAVSARDVKRGLYSVMEQRESASQSVN